MGINNVIQLRGDVRMHKLRGVSGRVNNAVEQPWENPDTYTENKRKK